MEDNFWDDLASAFSRPIPSAPPQQPTEPVFSAPHHTDARAIWLACGFHEDDQEPRQTIERALWMWATDMNMLTQHPKSGICEIAWKRTSDVGSHTIRSAWPAFLKWFFITCR
jgi:hypothetical protein